MYAIVKVFGVLVYLMFRIEITCMCVRDEEENCRRVINVPYF